GEHPKILEQLVSSIGKKKRECVVPLTKEKEMIEQKIQKAETSKSKYLKLYERSVVDENIFIERIQEIEREIQELTHRKLKIQCELGRENDVLLSSEYIQQILYRIVQLLSVVPNEEKKLLYHLIIEKIVVTKEREIKEIYLNISKEIQKDLIERRLLSDKKDNSLLVFPKQLHVVRITI